MRKLSFKAARSREPHIAAILSADMVGYSQHMCRDEAGTVLLLRSLRRNLLYPNAKLHGGRIIKSSGDGVLVEFPSTRQAVHCAIELQRALLSLNDSAEESHRIFFRMGIGVGDVTVEEDGDVYGNSVNVASRLENIAPPGGICISRAALDQIGDHIQCEPVDLGLVQLKNIDRFVQVFAITPEFIGRKSGTNIQNSATAAAESQSSSRKLIFVGISVLLAASTMSLSSDRRIANAKRMDGDMPIASGNGSLSNRKKAEYKGINSGMSVIIMAFKNPEGGPQEDLLAETIAEDIASDLTHIDGISVIANSIAMSYKNKTFDPRELGRSLGVRYIFSGTIHHSDGRFRINAQLVDASTGAQVWADRFKSREVSLIDIEEEIVNRLVKTLTEGINEVEMRRINTKR